MQTSLRRTRKAQSNFTDSAKGSSSDVQVAVDGLSGDGTGLERKRPKGMLDAVNGNTNSPGACLPTAATHGGGYVATGREGKKAAAEETHPTTRVEKLATPAGRKR